MTTDRKTLAEFIAEHGITATVQRTDRNPHFEDDSHMTRHFKVTLKNGKSRMTVYFSQGSAHTKEPTAQDVLSCLAMDSAGVENAGDFEGWCNEYGYDTDSRKHERTYKACEKHAEKLKRLLGDDAYNALLWETEND